jgi:hypothetical protein
MKKLTLASLISVCSCFWLLPGLAVAGGPDSANVKLTASPSSAVADNSSSITISLNITHPGYRCPDGYISYNDVDCANSHGGSVPLTDIGQSCSTPLVVSGSGNTLSSNTIHTDSNGNGSATLKSSVAETKTITLVYDGSLPCGFIVQGSVTATFTAPAPAPAPTKKTVATPAPAAPVAPAPPAQPTADTVTVAGTKVDTTQPISLEQNKPLVLSGKTVPNGVVTLTIHSTPKTATATADKDGNWSYTVQGLEAGDHYVEAAVMDPATKQTSPTAKLISFTVKPVTAVVSAPKASKKSSSTLPLIAGILFVGLLAAGAFWVYKQRTSKPNTPPPPASPIQPASG